MSIRSKNGAKPRVTKTPTIEPRTEETDCSPPAEQPLIDEWSQLRSEFAVIIAEVLIRFQTGPVEKLIREIQAELVSLRDPRPEYDKKVLVKKLRVVDRKLRVVGRSSAGHYWTTPSRQGLLISPLVEALSRLISGSCPARGARFFRQRVRLTWAHQAAKGYREWLVPAETTNSMAKLVVFDGDHDDGRFRSE